MSKIKELEKEQKQMLARIGGSIVLFLTSYVVRGASLYLQIAAYLLIGYDVLYGAIRGVFRGALLDEKFLMAVATVGATYLGEYPEAVFVMLFYQVGELFSDMAMDKSRKSIGALLALRPDTARVWRGGREETVSPDKVKAGEEILVYPGERVPLDGVILEGKAQLDTAALTGEPLPQIVGTGDMVYSGCLSLDGVLRLRVEKPLAESTVTRIMEMVDAAAAQQARPEAFITKFAHIYTPLVCLFALLLAVVPPLFFGNFGAWLHRGLVFLVVSCPCALVLSVPLAYFGGVGGAAKRGILIKGANILETLADADTFVFDKTGTLTAGTFSVCEVKSETMPEAELLRLAGAAEKFSAHPMGKALATDDAAQVTDIREHAGEGVEATVDGKNVLVGNERLMARWGIKPKENGAGIVHVAVCGGYAGWIRLADTVKPCAAKTINALRKEGIKRTVMLTGDKQAAAKGVAEAVGIDEVHASLLPGEKLSHMERLCKVGKAVYVGDGINDAPAMARADVSVAMGALGSEAAIEAADIVLMDDSPTRLVSALQIAKKTKRVVRQNILFSLLVKGAVLLLGAFGLAGMFPAALADVGVSLLAVLNSLRTLGGKK